MNLCPLLTKPREEARNELRGGGYLLKVVALGSRPYPATPLSHTSKLAAADDTRGSRKGVCGPKAAYDPLLDRRGRDAFRACLFYHPIIHPHSPACHERDAV